VRAALRALAAEGLAVIEPNRGAAVATLDRDAVLGLYELRTALETEAVRLALDRHDGRLPDPVHAAAKALERACKRRSAAGIVEAHDAVHRALVEAGGSARIAAAHRALAGEIRLFTIQLPPRWTPERMAADHLALVADLERDGPDALRRHLREAADSVLADL
jgi:DNA-binding GntR family transcriptional regulator